MDVNLSSDKTNQANTIRKGSLSQPNATTNQSGALVAAKDKPKISADKLFDLAQNDEYKEYEEIDLENPESDKSTKFED